MVHGLAAQLGGTLYLRSKPGEGTTAEMWLPAAREPAGQEEIEHPPLVVARRAATILLVDDEDIVRRATADMLPTSAIPSSRPPRAPRRFAWCARAPPSTSSSATI
jgi:hypothetical protein